MEVALRSAVTAAARPKAPPALIVGKTYPINASSSSFAARVQHGIGCLVARTAKSSGDSNVRPTSDNADNHKDRKATTKASTHLTTVSHQAPYRLIPLRSISVRDAGAAVCYLGSYGGGLLPGDHLELTVRVEPNATLGLLTQGSTRIYRQPVLTKKSESLLDDSTSTSSSMTRSRATFVVDAGGLLVVAPDPVTPFATASYEQEQTVRAHPDASLCVIDWFSAGRVTNGEIWRHEHLKSTNVFHLLGGGRLDSSSDDAPSPTFIDSVRFDPDHLLSAAPSFPCHAVASMTLYGDQVKVVVEMCRHIQRESMDPYTLTRQPSSTSPDDHNSGRAPDDGVLASIGLTGRVLMSLSEIPATPASSGGASVFVARWAASSNEDLYRLFHLCLLPLAQDFGIELYRDRIKATQSSLWTASNTTATSDDDQRSRSAIKSKRLDDLTKRAKAATQGRTLPDENSGNRVNEAFSNHEKFWSTLILADSALPVGSFAHSNGLEAAAQLQLLSGKNGAAVDSSAVESFVSMATQSTLELFAPAVIAANEARTAEEWHDADRQLHLRLVSNPPACRASLDQGRSLLRVSTDWSGDLKVSATLLGDVQRMLQDERSSSDDSSSFGHLASVFGVVTALQGLDSTEACHLLGYCVARDIVSAAVRMNLLGPMAGVGVLGRAHGSALAGIQESSNKGPTTASSSCSPLLDIIQPCHDVLATRLFRT